MSEFSFVNIVALPVFFGLVGFIEPCSIGSTLVMIKQMEGRSGQQKIAQMLVSGGSRSVFIGMLGVIAAGVGSAFLGFQRGAWLLLGALYRALGVMYLSGRAGS